MYFYWLWEEMDPGVFLLQFNVFLLVMGRNGSRRFLLQFKVFYWIITVQQIWCDELIMSPLYYWEAYCFCFHRRRRQGRCHTFFYPFHNMLGTTFV